MKTVAGVGELSGDDGHDGGDAPVHQRGSETADDPQCDVRVVEDDEVVEVFERRESGAHRESENRRIDQERDPVPRDEHHDQRALQDFFHQRGDVARESGFANPGGGGDVLVDKQAGDGGQPAHHDHQGHRPQPHQLEAVEQHQGDQEREDRQQTECDAKTGMDDEHR